MVIAGIVLTLGLIAYLMGSNRIVVTNVGLVTYNFFLGSASFASIVCVQGAFLNFAQEFTLKSTFYILGCMVVVALLG